MTIECNTNITASGEVTYSFAYTGCPYQYPCGKKPCEMGEPCPGKKAERIVWPYIPYQPWTPTYPVTPWYYTVTTNIVTEGTNE